MNTQTFAQAQNITPINDDALIDVNGAGAGKTLDLDIFKYGIPIIGGGYKEKKITRAADY